MLCTFFQKTSGNSVWGQKGQEIEQVSRGGIVLLSGFKGDLTGGGDAVRIVSRLALGQQTLSVLSFELFELGGII
jgi:hypothetical protein